MSQICFLQIEGDEARLKSDCCYIDFPCKVWIFTLSTCFGEFLVFFSDSMVFKLVYGFK